MYLLPLYRFTFTPLFGISGPLVFFIGILGAAVLACRGELRQVPAALMRPKAPRLGSGILLEKMSFVWDRLSFLQKVTARNLFRYKKRMFMTVFGIGGCMALLLFGFAIRDSVHDLMPRQYEETTVYDILAVSLPEDLAELQELVRTQTADGEAGMLALMVTTGAVRTEDGEELSEQIFVIPDGEDISPYIHLIPAKERTTELHGTAEGGTVERRTDEGGTELQLSDGMIAFTQNASTVLGFREGDDVELRTVDLKKAVVPAGVIVKNYLGNSVFMNAATYRKYFAEPENNAVLVKLNGMDGEKAFSAYERIRESDIVITGEGRIDSQTLNGKAPFMVMKAGVRYGKPVIGICGITGDGYEECLKAGFKKIAPLNHPVMETSEAIRSVEETVRELFTQDRISLIKA